MSKKEKLALVVALHAALGEYLEGRGGGSRDEDDDDDGEAGERDVFAEFEDQDIREVAKAMELGSARSIGRMKRDKLVALFDEMSDAEVAEAFEGGDDEEEGRDEFFKGLKIGDLRELAVEFGVAKRNKIASERKRTVIIDLLSDISLAELQGANDDDDDDDEGDEDERQELEALLSGKEVPLSIIREMAVDFQLITKRKVKDIRHRSKLVKLFEETSLSDVQDYLADTGDDDDDEDEEEAPPRRTKPGKTSGKKTGKTSGKKTGRRQVDEDDDDDEDTAWEE